MSHTPLPWHTQPDGAVGRCGIYAGGNDDIIICDVTDEDLEVDGQMEANAEFIVLACNNFESLLEALETAREIIKAGYIKDYPQSWPIYCGQSRAMQKIDAAIAKAKGGQP